MDWGSASSAVTTLGLGSHNPSLSRPRFRFLPNFPPSAGPRDKQPASVKKTVYVYLQKHASRQNNMNIDTNIESSSDTVARLSTSYYQCQLWHSTHRINSTTRCRQTFIACLDPPSRALSAATHEFTTRSRDNWLFTCQRRSSNCEFTQVAGQRNRFITHRSRGPNWQRLHKNTTKNHAEPRTLYYQDRSDGSSELSFRFQPGAAATQRPASETNAFTTGYTESAVLFDECATILMTKKFIKLVRCI
jgi:hypothetical protein